MKPSQETYEIFRKMYTVQIMLNTLLFKHRGKIRVDIKLTHLISYKLSDLHS